MPVWVAAVVGLGAAEARPGRPVPRRHSNRLRSRATCRVTRCVVRVSVVERTPGEQLEPGGRPGVPRFRGAAYGAMASLGIPDVPGLAHGRRPRLDRGCQDLP